MSVSVSVSVFANMLEAVEIHLDGHLGVSLILNRLRECYFSGAGVSNQEDCAIKIRNLESKLDSIVCTIKDRRELEKHVPMPSETIVEYDKPALLFSLREEIKQMEATVEEAATASAKRSKWRFMGARDAGSAEELRLVYGVAERTESDGAASLVQKLRAIIYTLDDHGQWFAYQVCCCFTNFGTILIIMSCRED